MSPHHARESQNEPTNERVGRDFTRRQGTDSEVGAVSPRLPPNDYNVVCALIDALKYAYHVGGGGGGGFQGCAGDRDVRQVTCHPFAGCEQTRTYINNLPLHTCDMIPNKLSAAFSVALRPAITIHQGRSRVAATLKIGESRPAAAAHHVRITRRAAPFPGPLRLQTKRGKLPPRRQRRDVNVLAIIYPFLALACGAWL